MKLKKGSHTGFFGLWVFSWINLYGIMDHTLHTFFELDLEFAEILKKEHTWEEKYHNRKNATRIVVVEIIGISTEFYIHSMLLRLQICVLETKYFKYTNKIITLKIIYWQPSCIYILKSFEVKTNIFLLKMTIVTHVIIIKGKLLIWKMKPENETYFLLKMSLKNCPWVCVLCSLFEEISSLLQ